MQDKQLCVLPTEPMAQIRPEKYVYCRWKSTVDIESERQCQVNKSIKMIQSRARCRLVCSPPPHCVKFLAATLRTV